MSLRVAGRSFAVLFILSLFLGCGDLDSLFSKGEAYQVTAMVNGNSLDTCSIVRSGDKIRPFFAASVERDPDLTGLLVYIEDSNGAVVGDQVLYILQPYYGNTVDAAAHEKSGRLGDETAGEHDLDRQAAWGFIESLAIREQWSFIDSIPEAENPPIVVPVRSLNRAIPFFPLPAMEVGPYKLVFEAVGKKETLHRTETDIFFLDNAEFLVKDISIYLPRVSDTQLIPPGATVMLESRLDFDSRFDPYVVWYNGKSTISEGKISEGAGTILWKAPERTGFYSLRIEVFPFQLRGSFAGFFREITLPVSSKATTVSKGYFFGEGPEYPAVSPLAMGTIFPEYERTAASAVLEEGAPVLPRPALLRWYQFEGDLYDTVSGFGAEETLVSGSDKAPQWAASGQTYGLSTGPEDPYLLSPATFLRSADGQGGGIFLFHVKSLADGPIFSAFFPSQSSEAEGVTMDVLRKGNAIVLRLVTRETAVEMPVYLPIFEMQALIPAAVEFYIRPNRMEAKLSVGERMPLASLDGNIRLAGVLAGEARVRLGGGEAAPRVNTVWNEFAVLYSPLPIQEEEIPTVAAPAEEEPVAEAAIADDRAERRMIKVEVTIEYRDIPELADQDALGAAPDEPAAAEPGDGEDLPPLVEIN